MRLDHKTRDRIDDYCRSGDKAADNGKFEAAIALYTKARELLPAPKRQWQAETWIACAIGDAWFMQDEFETALPFFLDACVSPRGDENTFVQLRTGQCFLKTNDLKKAQVHLLNAYELGGEEVFDDEEPDYFSAIAALV
jgi:tetratricopeptide (TPR) repeat protein